MVKKQKIDLGMMTDFFTLLDLKPLWLTEYCRNPKDIKSLFDIGSWWSCDY